MVVTGGALPKNLTLVEPHVGRRANTKIMPGVHLTMVVSAATDTRLALISQPDEMVKLPLRRFKLITAVVVPKLLFLRSQVNLGLLIPILAR
jgi:hypothetical protein